MAIPHEFILIPLIFLKNLASKLAYILAKATQAALKNS